MVLVPELGLGIFLSQNSAQAFEPIVQVPDRIIDRHLGAAFRPDLAAEEDTDALADLAGTYLNNRRVFTTFAAIVGASARHRHARLTRRHHRRTPLESTSLPPPPDAPDVFESATGARIAFLRDEDGRVAASPTSRASTPTSASASSPRP
jgi:hypothetical protein